MQSIEKLNIAPHVLSHRGYDFLEEKLMEEKQKKWWEQAAQFGSSEAIIDPSSPIRQHMKWKLARNKKSSQMTSEVTHQIADRIVS